MNTSQVLAHIAEESGASLRELEYVVASSGIDRSDESYRKKLFVLKGGEPLCVAKWEGSVSHRLRREHDLQSTLFRKSLPVVNALKLLTLDDSLLMIEEYIDVPHVEALVERRELNTAQAVRIAHDLFVAILKGTREDSTREAFIAEFEERYSAPEITAVLKKSQRDALAHAKSTLTQHYPAHRTFSHALYHQDYRLANILFNGSRARLFDFEFSCNSHFWFLDWFRLFLYSEGLTPSAIDSSLYPEHLAAVIENEKARKACWLLAVLDDYLVRRSITPSYLQPLIKERLGNMLHSLEQLGAPDSQIQVHTPPQALGANRQPAINQEHPERPNRSTSFPALFKRFLGR